MLISNKRLAARINRPKAAERPVAALSAEAVAYLGALRRRNCSPKTLRAYRLELLRVERVLGMPVVQAGHRDVERYLTWVGERTVAGKPVKSCTVNKALNVLRGVSKWGVRQGLITVDPTGRIDPAKEPKKLPIHLDSAEVEALLTAANAGRNAARNVAMLATTYYLGARASEVAGLELADVDFAGGTVRLFGKGSKERRVPLPEALAGLLRAWLAERGEGPGQVFGVTYDGMRAVFNAARERARLPRRYTLHKLRHTYATRLLDAGVPPHEIQPLLGHASITTTMIYAHARVKAETVQRIAEAL